MKFFGSLLSIFCLPALLFHSIPAYTQEVPGSDIETTQELYIPRDESGRINPWEMFKFENLSYNNILEFINVLESDEFWDNLTEEDAHAIADYLVWSMRYSVPINRPDLQEQAEQATADLEAIMRGDPVWHYADVADAYSLKTSNDLKDYKIIHCGLGKAFKKTKKWVKRNKGPIIICAIVVTVLIVAAATGGVGGSSAVAVGGALAGASMNDPARSNRINKPGEVGPPSYPPPPSSSSKSEKDPEPPSPFTTLLPHTADKLDDIAATVSEKKEELLESLPEIPSSELSEEAVGTPFRESVVSFAHDVVDSVASKLEYFYEDAPLKDQVDFYLAVGGYHEKVDEIFSLEKPDRLVPEMQIGILPVPGGPTVPAVRGGTAIGGALTGQAVVQALVQTPVNITVYQAANEITGEVVYVGITNNVPRRTGEHLRQKNINIEPLKNVPLLNRYDAHAVEQTLIEHHQLQKNGGTLMNKINSIAEKNPERANSLRRGREILKEAEYPGIE